MGIGIVLYFVLDVLYRNWELLLLTYNYIGSVDNGVIR